MEKEYIKAVAVMQEFIQEHVNEEISEQDIAKTAGYSVRHCKRIFKALTGKTITEYVRLMRLTDAAGEIALSNDNILEIALSYQYNSHEGFTKAFSSAFGISPSAYRKGQTPIQFFVPYPINYYYLLMNGENNMESKKPETKLCTATIIERPDRKLIFLPSESGKDYWSFCQEKGCDWEGLLNSLACKLDSAAILTLNAALVPSGFSNCAAGIEVPCSYDGAIPDGYMVADLKACKMLYFQSGPFENESDFGAAISEVFQAYEKYDPSSYGYAYDYTIAPCFNFGAKVSSGAKIAFPVKSI